MSERGVPGAPPLPEQEEAEEEEELGRGREQGLGGGWQLPGQEEPAAEECGGFTLMIHPELRLKFLSTEYCDSLQQINICRLDLYLFW